MAKLIMLIGALLWTSIAMAAGDTADASARHSAKTGKISSHASAQGIERGRVVNGSSGKSSSCFRFFSVGSTIKMGLRNTCTQCEEAVINYVYNGHNQIKTFKVGPKSQIYIDIKNTLSEEIIDEQPCD